MKEGINMRKYCWYGRLSEILDGKGFFFFNKKVVERISMLYKVCGDPMMCKISL